MTKSPLGWRALGALCVLLLAPWAHANALRIGSWEHEVRAPLTVVSETILAQAYAELNQPVEFVDLPIRRAMSMMLNQELDGNTHRVAELASEQPALYRVDTPVNLTQVRVYSLSPNPRPTGWSQFASLRVAYQRGVLLIERNLPSDSRRVEAASLTEVFRLVKSGMADIGLAVEPVQSLPNPLAASAGLGRLDAVIDQIPLHHYLLGRHREIGARLNSVLKRMQASGELDAIRARVLRELQ